MPAELKMSTVKALLTPPRGLFDFGHSRGGLIREGGLFEILAPREGLFREGALIETGLGRAFTVHELRSRSKLR